MKNGVIDTVMINLYLKKGNINFLLTRLMNKQKYCPAKHSKNVLLKEKPLKTLNSVYNEIGVTQIEKANRNIGFICKWFYTPALIKEISLDQTTEGI